MRTWKRRFFLFGNLFVGVFDRHMTFFPSENSSFEISDNNELFPEPLFPVIMLMDDVDFNFIYFALMIFEPKKFISSILCTKYVVRAIWPLLRELVYVFRPTSYRIPKRIPIITGFRRIFSDGYGRITDTKKPAGLVPCGLLGLPRTTLVIVEGEFWWSLHT